MKDTVIDPYQIKPAIITDLSEFDTSQNEISIRANAKNIDLLENFKIDKLWLFAAKENLSYYQLKMKNEFENTKRNLKNSKSNM